MKACAVLFLLLPVFPFSRLTSPARYLRIFSSLINFVSVLYGVFPGSNFLCPKINNSRVLKRHKGLVQNDG